jgi:hypothetical protein
MLDIVRATSSDPESEVGRTVDRGASVAMLAWRRRCGAVEFSRPPSALERRLWYADN